MAIKPNSVQTLENTPVLIIYGGLCNINFMDAIPIATKMALKLTDYVVMEAGFMADLGAEKFLDIKSRIGRTESKCYRDSGNGGRALENTAGNGELKIDNSKKHIENMKI